jgi:Leucine-rich repeat (LRR) protein
VSETDNQKINNYYKFDKCDDISKRIINAFGQNLTELYLSDNQITVIDPSIGSLGSPSNPATLGNLINLTELDLSNNQITVIDPSMGSLGSPSNPATLGNLINLTVLSLSNNQITVIDPVYVTLKENGINVMI